MPLLVTDDGGGPPPPSSPTSPAPAPTAPPPPPAPTSTQAQPIPQAGTPLVDTSPGVFVPAPLVGVSTSAPPPPSSTVVSFADEINALAADQPDFAGLVSPGSPEFMAAIEAAGGDELPAWTFDDPFATRSLESSNPVLRGGDWVRALVDACTYYHLDARAVAADAMGEGLNGAIGDGGLAYGPFQDHLTEFPGRPFYGRGKNNAVVNAWAWTRNGLEYALRQMVTSTHSAAHLTGAAAVSAIVRGYERPADIPGAIALRSGYYKILLSQGDQWVAYIAAKAVGPTKGGKQLIGADTSPGTGPAGVPKPTKQWQTTLHFFANDVPAAGAAARKAGGRARAAVRSNLWRAPTG